MASVVPSRLPSRATKGEERVHRLLQRLPDGCVAYHEPDVDGRHPDFVVILPTHGILVIEVKGWYAKDILSLDGDKVRVDDRHGRDVLHRHPDRQAREYKFRLMDLARGTRFADLFLHRHGPHEGAFRFPVGHFTVLSNIHSGRLEVPRDAAGSRLGDIFPRSRTACRDDLAEWETLTPPELLERLAGYFDPCWPIAPLGAEEVKALRAIIHPEIYFDDRISLSALEDTSLPVHEQLGVVKALDLRQEDFAEGIGEGHRIVYGVAGSGKTLLLLARARRLAARRPEARILVVCYNRTLARWLAGRLHDVPSVRVRHFHRWAAENGVSWTDHPDDMALGEALQSALEQGARDRAAFDAVLVDEAQDFEPGWFICLLAAMKDPEDGDLLIVADGAQGLYRRWQAGLSWAKLGIKARGRTASARFMLDQNYRNAAEIIAAAESFASLGADATRVAADADHSDGDDDHDDGMVAVRIDLARCVRSVGANPLLVSAADRRGELAAAFRLIRDLTGGLWDGRPIAPLQPQEIAILYPGANHREKELLAGFVAGIGRQLPIVWLNDPSHPEARDRVADPGVKVQTIHSSKGLQYRAVIVVWTDKLPARECASDPGRLQAERRLLYVAMTRAESFLALTASGRSAFTTELAECPAVRCLEPVRTEAPPAAAAQPTPAAVAPTRSGAVAHSA